MCVCVCVCVCVSAVALFGWLVGYFKRKRHILVVENDKVNVTLACANCLFCSSPLWASSILALETEVLKGKKS